MVFAQAGGGFGGGRANQDVPPEMVAFILVFVLIVLAISLTIQIFFLLTLFRCYSRIAPANRRMEPGMVWLNLIPCFGTIWIFFTNIRLADSLRDEFDQRRLHGDGDFGRTLGITYPILALLGAIPYIGVLFGIPSLICFILYWVKIAGYSRQLLEDGQDQAANRDRDRGEDDQGHYKSADRM
jgi:hypothetical protein